MVTTIQFFQVQLDRRQKSLASVRASSLDSFFCQSATWLSLVLCTSA